MKPVTKRPEEMILAFPTHTFWHRWMLTAICAFADLTHGKKKGTYVPENSPYLQPEDLEGFDERDFQDPFADGSEAEDAYWKGYLQGKRDCWNIYTAQVESLTVDRVAGEKLGCFQSEGAAKVLQFFKRWARSGQIEFR